VPLGVQICERTEAAPLCTCVATSSMETGRNKGWRVHPDRLDVRFRTRGEAAQSVRRIDGRAPQGDLIGLLRFTLYGCRLTVYDDYGKAVIRFPSSTLPQSCSTRVAGGAGPVSPTRARHSWQCAGLHTGLLDTLVDHAEGNYRTLMATRTNLFLGAAQREVTLLHDPIPSSPRRRLPSSPQTTRSCHYRSSSGQPRDSIGRRAA